ncbi:hypothetical protein ABFS82_13G126200 [Erythranthe guttata]|uniref:Glycine-rich protein n=1 Tax=Erythranthe guttata TaxID=4155 RepID=A0A022QMQ4_ERYGU|nr:hypothetical protein MIMGU_mgv1a015830mg [Erythranthe guttata]
MAIKILLLVAIAAFAVAVNGRMSPAGKSAADVQTAYFRFRFPPYGIPFRGFRGGVGARFGGAVGAGIGGRPGSGGAGGVGFGGRTGSGEGGLGAGGFDRGDGWGFDGGDGTGDIGRLKDGAGAGNGTSVGGGSLGDGSEGGLLP